MEKQWKILITVKLISRKKTVSLLTISVTLESSKLVGVVSASAVLKLSSSNTSEISSSSEKSLAKEKKFKIHEVDFTKKQLILLQRRN